MVEEPRGVTRHVPKIRSGAADGLVSIAERIRRAGLARGFVRVGFARAEDLGQAAAAHHDWVAEGHHGDMSYLAPPPVRSNPKALLEGAKTVVVTASPYSTEVDASQGGGELVGFVARYARGTDYHSVIRERLRLLADDCADIVGAPIVARACVDTAPLLERAFAARAGVGFLGKSAMTIVPGRGSYVLLGELVVDFEIPADEPMSPRCGSCRACLDACPTDAFVRERVLNARRCIAYLTIELRGPIPRELRSAMGMRVFGCDECQVVCPFNASKRDPNASPLPSRPEVGAPDLLDLLNITSGAYRRLVAGSAMRRVSRTRLARNAAVALGNAEDRRAVPALVRTLVDHTSALVRGHAAWALGRLGGDVARAALERVRATDRDAWVRSEAARAVGGAGAPDAPDPDA